MRTSEFKSTYIKKFPPPAIPHDKNGNPLKAALIDKPKEKREKDGRLRTTPYFLKSYVDSDDAKQYLATIEAVGASLLRLVFGPSFTPKVRVVAQRSNETKPWVISRSIRFKTATKLPNLERIKIVKKIIAEKQRGLAKLFLSIFCFEDPDVHTSNWGLGENNDVVKIDHDRMFCLFSKTFQGKCAALGEETDIKLLMDWENLIYKTEDFFGIISPDDIRELPLFKDTKPYNQPVRFKTDLQSLNEGLLLFSPLSSDPLFIQWKFFYLTKYLLFVTPENVQKIIASHSIGLNSIDEQFCGHIIERHRRIKETLFCMKEYQHYLSTVFKDQLSNFSDEIEEYNREFQDKKTGIIKPHKEKYTINPITVEAGFAALVNDLRNTASTNTCEKMTQREIELDIARIQRELSAGKSLKKVSIHEASKLAQATALAQSLCFRKLPSQITTSEKKIAHDFFKNFSSPGEVENYLKKNPRRTCCDFFNSVADRCTTEHIPELNRRIKENTLFIDKKITSLITKYNQILSKQQLEQIWSSHESCGIEDKVHVLVRIIENCPFENIPTQAFRWMIGSREQIESIHSGFSRHRVFHQLHTLITNCHQLIASPSLLPDAPATRAAKSLLQLLQDPKHQLILPAKGLSDFTCTLSSVLLRCCVNTSATRTEHADHYVVKLHYENGEFILQSEAQNTPSMAQRLFRWPSAIPTPPVNCATELTNNAGNARR